VNQRILITGGTGLLGQALLKTAPAGSVLKET
jgi:dTDP-4-dehydrorhamnose reductase